MYRSPFECVYEINVNGKFFTVRSCGGPVGAYNQLTHKKRTIYKRINDRVTIVDGNTVTKISVGLG